MSPHIELRTRLEYALFCLSVVLHFGLTHLSEAILAQHLGGW